MAKIVPFISKKEVNNMQKVKEYTDLQQFAKIVLFYVNGSSNLLYKTKLNKLLFYTQFLYYKMHDSAFLNARFIKDHYGPVMEDLDKYIDSLEEAGYITVVPDEYGNIITSNYTIRDEEYTQQELEVINEVLDKFDNYTSRRISLYSHDEILWLETELKEEIPLRRAKELNDFD